VSKPYIVRWEVEVDADSALEAAKQAHEMMQDPESTATVFEVTEIGSGWYDQVDVATGKVIEEIEEAL
jgi:hypothetical protein